MWYKIKNNFMSYGGMTYRKRYLCPECGQYSLKICTDSSVECEDGDQLELSREEIKNLIEKDNFSGYYTSEEIKKKFYFDEQDFKKMLLECCVEYNPKSVFTKKENAMIDKLKDEFLEIDSLLDDVFIEFERHRVNLEERTDIIKDFEILFSLIEEANYMFDLAVTNIILYDYTMFAEPKEYYFSGRFFIHNSVFYIVGGWERLINSLAILFGINYDEDNEKNTTQKLYTKMKKGNCFENCIEIKKKIDELNSSGLLKRIFKIRQEGDHFISSYYKGYIDNIEKLINSMYQDADEVLKDDAIKIVHCAEYMKEVFVEIVKYIRNNKFKQIDSLRIEPIVKKMYMIDIEDMLEKEDRNLLIAVDDIEKIYCDIYHEFLDIYSFFASVIKHPFYQQIANLYLDIIMRLHEISRCLICICNIISNDNYEDPLYVGFNNVLNIEYYIYASMCRVYAVFDKVAKLLVAIHKIDAPSTFYFKDILRIIYDTNDSKYRGLLEEIESIKSEYNVLFDFRNKIFHQIRMGVFCGEKGEECCNQIILLHTYKNTLNLLKLLQYIKKNAYLDTVR